MDFWGSEIKKGCIEIVKVPAGMELHLTQACLGPYLVVLMCLCVICILYLCLRLRLYCIRIYLRKNRQAVKGERIFLECEVDNGPKIILCSLSNGGTENVPLNHILSSYGSPSFP